MEVWNITRSYEENKPKAEIMEEIGLLVEEKGVDEVGEELVFLAAQYAHTEALEWLEDKSVDINITDRYERTPLHILGEANFRYYIPEEGDIRKCTQFLLSQGVSVLRKDENEYMACYHYAARSGNYEFVEELNGKKLDLTNRDGNTGIHIASDYVRHAMSSLHYAADLVEKATKNYNETIERLKNQGQDYTEEQIAGYIENNRITTPAQAQAEYDQLVENVDKFYKTVKAFVDGGVDPDEKNDRGQSALDIAVEYGAKKIAAYLSGEDVENEDALSAGGMSIHQAVENEDIDAIKTIIDRGADLNEVNEIDGSHKGFTALAIACMLMNVEIITLLIDGGADVNAKDNEGRTCLLFLGRNARVDDKNKQLKKEVIKLFKKSGYDFNSTVNENSDTLLTYNCKNNAYSHGTDTLITELLKAGADVNQANLTGQTALMYICVQNGTGMENLQIMLLENGADVTAKDKDGNTALHHAAMNRSDSLAKSMSDMLLEFGKVDVNAVNNTGQSALDIATETGNEPLVKWLLGKM